MASCFTRGSYLAGWIAEVWSSTGTSYVKVSGEVGGHAVHQFTTIACRPNPSARSHRPGDAAFCERLQVRDVAVVAQRREEVPVGAVDGEDRDAAGDAARLAPQLGALHLQQRVMIGLDARD